LPRPSHGVAEPGLARPEERRDAEPLVHLHVAPGLLEVAGVGPSGRSFGAGQRVVLRPVAPARPWVGRGRVHSQEEGGHHE
jgi:hypothetical protein